MLGEKVSETYKDLILDVRLKATAVWQKTFDDSGTEFADSSTSSYSNRLLKSTNLKYMFGENKKNLSFYSAQKFSSKLTQNI